MNLFTFYIVFLIVKPKSWARTLLYVTLRRNVFFKDVSMPADFDPLTESDSPTSKATPSDTPELGINIEDISTKTDASSGDVLSEVTGEQSVSLQDISDTPDISTSPNI